MKNCFKTLLVPSVAFTFIILLAFFFRFYKIDWDQGQHLHPDERFLTMVATDIKIPSSISEYLNPQISPMSPYNNNYSFFVYGTFPLYLTKIVGMLTGNNQYGNIYLVGRALSAFFDLGIVFLLYKIGRKIFNQKTALLSAFLYSIMVLPIQLSHFFAVDTFLTFFLVLSFYFLGLLLAYYFQYQSHKTTALFKINPLLLHIFLGISFGLSLACKISALYFFPIIALGYFFLFAKNLKQLKKQGSLVLSGLVFVLVFLFIFRLAQPTAFSSGNLLNWQLNPQLLSNIKELKGMSGSNSWFPPSVQWHSTKPIIFPFKNLILWGMGLPLGIISVFSLGNMAAILLSCLPTLGFVLWRRKKGFSKNEVLKNHNLLFILFNFLVVLWIFGLFTYLGFQFCKTMRYFLPLYPFLALLGANFLSKLNIKYVIFIILAALVYPISFLSIYSHPVTRISASKWIYKNISTDSIVTFEEWDDGLPLSLPNYPPNSYKTESLFMYDPDTPEKWQKINEKLAKADFVFITSNRAYGSTMKLPKKYPQTIRYYQSLFNETEEFTKAAEFTSYPCFPPFGNKQLFCFNDDSAEEAFTVYDHPKVMIFKKDQ